MNEMITWEKRLADPLAVILAVLRSDWQVPGIMAALADPRLRDKNPAGVVRAAVKLASNPKVRTPAVLAMDGEHWMAVVAEAWIKRRRFMSFMSSLLFDLNSGSDLLNVSGRPAAPTTSFPRQRESSFSRASSPLPGTGFPPSRE